jgi:hypothetical protein
MAKATSPRSGALQRLLGKLPKVSATTLVGHMQKVTGIVMSRGAVVVTRHDEPTMVLMSIDRYVQLEQAGAPNLDALTRQFDEMFARMQEADGARNMADAFAMSPEELGEAALRAAK